MPIPELQSMPRRPAMFCTRMIGSRGYGKIVLIKHSSGISTVYAHASKLLVHQGQWVRQGMKIAMSGRTGRVTAPHLHFEVRDGVTAVDPMTYLPRNAVARGPASAIHPHRLVQVHHRLSRRVRLARARAARARRISRALAHIRHHHRKLRAVAAAD